MIISTQTWRMEHRSVIVGGVPRTLRLVRFEKGWLASIDTTAGPTLGYDASPYLAISQAFEPLGIGMVDAIALAGPIPALTQPAG
jgi:hypothetical protein